MSQQFEAFVVQLEAYPAERLRHVGRATGRSPSQVASDWVLERLAFDSPPVGLSAGATVDAASRSEPTDKTVSENEALRARYRPDDVVILLVGESAPAGGTFFYRANSHLFHATREAFEQALGPMPEGQAFLEKFAAMDFWLYDLVEDPVNRKRGRPRKDTVSQGVGGLVAVLKETEPDFVIGVKASIEGPVRQAAMLAGMAASRVRVLPFPLYQWRDEYVQELARFLDPNREGPKDVKIANGERLTLHEAMILALEDLGGGPVPGRQLANEVVRRNLYERLDGGRPDYQQIVARAKKYPQRFDVVPTGIRLNHGSRDRDR